MIIIDNRETPTELLRDVDYDTICEIQETGQIIAIVDLNANFIINAIDKEVNLDEDKVLVFDLETHELQLFDGTAVVNPIPKASLELIY